MLHAGWGVGHMTAYRLHAVARRVGDFVLRIGECCLEKGEVYAVAGPNGCGKTTLLDLLAFLEPPDKGEVFFAGAAVDYADGAASLRLRRRVGYLMQKAYLFNMSVYDNVAYGLKLRRIRGEALRARVMAALEQLDLVPLARRNAHALSGGEAQRVALARTLALETEVLLLDEPTANVDQRHVRGIEERLLDTCRRHGTTVVLTTHSRDQAYRMSRNQVSIIDGEIRDIAYENVYAGELSEETDGLRRLYLGGLQISVAQGRSGSVTAAIDPQDVILSTQPLASSALNRFRGAVSKVEEVDGSLRVFVDIGVPMCALVTRRSYDGMNLNVGRDVWVTFKANAVKVI